jgi:hypothetical protein
MNLINNGKIFSELVNILLFIIFLYKLNKRNREESLFGGES